MFTKDELNEILKPWGTSIDNRPVPKVQQINYAYSEQDRKKAYDMACRWHGNYHDVVTSNDTLTDFICHQSDIIEMLANALGFANGRLEATQERLYRIKNANLCCHQCGATITLPDE